MIYNKDVFKAKQTFVKKWFLHFVQNVKDSSLINTFEASMKSVTFDN